MSALRLPVAVVAAIDRDERPTTRGDCAEAQRPCPWVSCRYHLLLDVGPCGSLRVSPQATGSRKRTLQPWEGAEAVERFEDQAVDHLDSIGETCALDVADGGGASLEEIGDLLGVSKERVRQVQEGALGRLRAAADAPGYEHLRPPLPAGEPT